MYIIIFLELFVLISAFISFLFFFKKKFELWIRDIIHDEVFDVINNFNDEK